MHQIQVIARGLIVGLKIPFRAVVLGKFARHIDMFILLSRKLFTRGVKFTTELQRLVQVNATLVGVTHVVRRHIVGGFADQVLKQIAVRLGDADRFRGHAVFTQRRFHIWNALRTPLFSGSR